MAPATSAARSRRTPPDHSVPARRRLDATRSLAPSDRGRPPREAPRRVAAADPDPPLMALFSLADLAGHASTDRRVSRLEKTNRESRIAERDDYGVWRAGVGRGIDRGIGGASPRSPDRSADARSAGHVLGPVALAAGKRLASPVVGAGSCPSALTAAVPHLRPAPGKPAGRAPTDTSAPGYFRMLTARATISATVTMEMTDCRAMASLAQRDSGSTSVGLNAEALVNAR
jgi:hypothetical protein